MFFPLLFLICLFLLVGIFLYHITRKANISFGFALINATQVFVIRIMYGSRNQVGPQMFCMGLTFATNAYAKQTLQN